MVKLGRVEATESVSDDYDVGKVTAVGVPGHCVFLCFALPVHDLSRDLREEHMKHT